MRPLVQHGVAASKGEQGPGRASARGNSAGTGLKKSDLTRERIVVAAKAAFLENGPEKATIQDVADRAGVGKATVYYYVRSKEELFLFLVDAVIGDLVRAMRREIAGLDDPVERLRSLLARHIAAMREAGPLLRTFHARPKVAHGEFVERMAPHRAEYLSLVAELVEEGQAAGSLAAGDPAVAARLAVGTIIGVFVQSGRGGRAASVPDAEAIADFVIGGLRRGQGGGQRT